MIIRIKALDTLFFRDGKPFNMADESWATGIFPPPPSVLYGTLRSAFLSQKGFTSSNIEASGKLKIKGVFFELEDTDDDSSEIVHWAPYDLVATNLGNVNQKLHLLRPKTASGISNQQNKLVYQLFPPQDEKERKDVDVVGGTDNLLPEFEKNYIKEGSVPESLKHIPISEILTTEPKVGIGRNNYTHVSDESALYRVGMQRLASDNQHLNIILDFWGLDIAPSGVLKMGGEGKSASYELYKDQHMQIPFPTLEKDVFKLYFATPAIFKNGWLPSWLDEAGFGSYEGIEIQLLAAATGKPMHIGGFDMKKKKPKPMLKAVPPGAVYYFRLLKGNQTDLKKAFHQKCISEEREKEGFGLSFVCQLNDELV